jgi:hypothetical protein
MRFIVHPLNGLGELAKRTFVLQSTANVPIEEDARQRFMKHFDLTMQRGGVECVDEWP